MPCTYKAETYEVVLRWTEKTRVKYSPNPKTEGSKSKVRYEKYAKAKTVGEALALGSYRLDLLFDYEHGYIKVLGGPTRKEPLDMIDRNKTWTKTDVVMATMHGQWKAWTKTFQVAEKFGTDRRNLTQDKAGGESTEAHVKRMEAEALASLILEESKKLGRKIVDADVEAVLGLWEWRQNTSRGNVMREGIKWVNSDTFGLLNSYDGRVVISPATRHYPSVSKIFSKWITDNYPSELGGRPVFTSINVNRGYAAALHRDGNNEGPSFIKGFGDYSGGKLRYWVDDDKTLGLQELSKQEYVTVDLKSHLLLFDGNRGHEVEVNFNGTRYTLVWFNIGRSERASEQQRKDLQDAGITVPAAQELTWAKNLLGTPRGYAKKHQGENAKGAQTWQPQQPNVSTVSTLSADRIKQAREQSRLAPVPADLEEIPPDAVFWKKRPEWGMTEDGLKTYTLFLVTWPERQLVRAVTGVEQKAGTARYLYKKDPVFISEPKLETTLLGDVRAWADRVIKISQKHNGAIKKFPYGKDGKAAQAKKPQPGGKNAAAKRRALKDSKSKAAKEKSRSRRPTKEVGATRATKRKAQAPKGKAMKAARRST